MKASTISMAALALMTSACGVAPQNTQTNGQSGLAAAQPASTVKKSGMYQLSFVTCSVPGTAQLPESLDVPSKFEVFFDAGAIMNGASGEVAATVLLEIPDVKLTRAVVEGSVLPNNNGSATVKYSVKSMDGTTKAVVIQIEGSAAEKATLKVDSQVVSYGCVANAR